MASNAQYLENLKKHNIELYNYFMRGMEIVETLNSKMFEAYIVGGAVRDYLLGKEFKDIDIATTATPREVLELFPEGNGRFSELGCVEIREGNMLFQITTFRDEHLVISRKSKNIHYSKKLTDDVYRRDYTINALALSSNYNIIDIVKGQRDLRCKRLRIIGKGRKRFKEDPLRILRGFELMSRYRLSFSAGTYNAVLASRKYVKDISNAKFTEMLYKIVNGQYARFALAQMSNLNLFNYDEIYRKWLISVCRKYKKTNAVEKLALLYFMFGSFPKNHSYSKELIDEMEKLIQMTNILEEQQIDEMMIYKYGVKLVMSANQMLLTYDRKYKNQAKLIKKIDSNLAIHERRDLNITSEEIAQMMKGYTGLRVAEVLDMLITKVVKGEVVNSNAALCQETLKIVNLDRHVQSEITVNEAEVAPQPNFEEPKLVIDIEKIKMEYALEFKSLYVTYMNGVTNYSELSVEEQEQISYQAKLKVRSELLNRNPKYHILVERGII